MVQRATKMLEYVLDQGRVEVSELAGMFAVSEVTVRKDLDQLEQRGLVRREHGYAVPVSTDNMRSRLAYHYDAKRRIARSAAESIGEGGLVMIESGSCCALLAEELATTRRDVTIVTNSAFIADFIRTAPYARLVLLGGDYQNESQVLVGPVAKDNARRFHVAQIFVGIDGYTGAAGFTAKDHLRADTMRAMSDQADEVVVLTESAKFGKQGAIHLFDTGEVSAVFTDDALPRPIQSQLTAAGVTITKVASA
ncbi:MAG: DeoR/GlpR family DNA-binding transcription regulator [Tetrasphaera sp.]